jgi:glycosyltransferase involved in cell wall biosynthesis
VRKGAHDLFAAFSKLRHPRKRLTIAGIIAPEILRCLSAELGREDVRALGPVPHLKLKALMAGSDVLVLPSVEEGLALVQVEALACGCPIIATTNTGALDLITDGQEGFIVPIRAPEAIAERLQRLADDPALRRSMGEAALGKARLINGWQSYGDQMVETYSRALKARG